MRSGCGPFSEREERAKESTDGDKIPWDGIKKGGADPKVCCWLDGKTNVYGERARGDTE